MAQWKDFYTRYHEQATYSQHVHLNFFEKTTQILVKNQLFKIRKQKIYIFCARFLLKYLGQINNNVGFTFDLIHIIIDVVVLVVNHLYIVNYDIHLSRNSFNRSLKTTIQFETKGFMYWHTRLIF